MPRLNASSRKLQLKQIWSCLGVLFSSIVVDLFIWLVTVDSNLHRYEYVIIFVILLLPVLLDYLTLQNG